MYISRGIRYIPDFALTDNAGVFFELNKAENNTESIWPGNEVFSNCVADGLSGETDVDFKDLFRDRRIMIHR